MSDTKQPGAEVKLPPFQAPRGDHGRKEMRRHYRASDFDAKHPNWTPTELYRRNAAMNKNLGLEGTSWNTEGYRESELWCQGCNGRHAKAPGTDTCLVCAGVEPIRGGRQRFVYPDFTGEVKR